MLDIRGKIALAHSRLITAHQRGHLLCFSHKQLDDEVAMDCETCAACQNAHLDYVLAILQDFCTPLRGRESVVQDPRTIAWLPIPWDLR